MRFSISSIYDFVDFDYDDNDNGGGIWITVAVEEGGVREGM